MRGFAAAGLGFQGERLEHLEVGLGPRQGGVGLPAVDRDQRIAGRHLAALAHMDRHDRPRGFHREIGDAPGPDRARLRAADGFLDLAPGDPDGADLQGVGPAGGQVDDPQDGRRYHEGEQPASKNAHRTSGEQRPRHPDSPTPAAVGVENAPLSGRIRGANPGIPNLPRPNLIGTPFARKTS
jgi:hypothetical protein